MLLKKEEKSRESFSNIMINFRAMPLIICNLGVEMIYVLNQRLGAQKVAKEKHAKGK